MKLSSLELLRDIARCFNKAENLSSHKLSTLIAFMKHTKIMKIACLVRMRVNEMLHKFLSAALRPFDFPSSHLWLVT